MEEKEKRRLRKYTAEFKAEAIALVESGEKPIAKLAEDLGVPKNSLYSWVSKARPKEESLLKSNPGDSEKEILRLKQENRLLKMERDILKKATAFFAKENQ